MEKKLFNKLIRSFVNNCADFTKLYEYYFPRIKNYIGHKYKSYHLGEDVAQEFFIKLFKMNLDKEIEHPTAWVYKVCDNLAKTLISKEGKDLLLNDEIVASTDIDIYECEESLRNGGISEERIEFLKKLDKETIHILILHFWEGYNYKEIADILGMRHDTVRRKVSKSFKKIKKIN